MSVTDPGTGLGELLRQADMRLDMGKPEEALKLTERGLASHPESDALWTLRAWAQANLGAHQEAIESAQRAIALNGDNQEAYVRLGFSIRDAGRAFEAYAAGAAVLRIDPDSVRGHIIVASSLADCWRKRFPNSGHFPAQARAALQRAVELAPEDPWVQVQCGVLLRWLGDDASAVPHFREALRLNPDRTQALRNLAEIDLKRHRRIRALRSLRAVLALEPGDSRVVRFAYVLCRKTTRAVVAASVVIAAISAVMALIAFDPSSGESDSSALFWTRTVVAGIATALTAGAFAYLGRIPVEFRRSLLRRRAGVPWAVAFALVPVSASAIGWTPPSWSGVPLLVFIGALACEIVLARTVDGDAFSEGGAEPVPGWGRPDQAPLPAPPVRRLWALVLDGVLVALACLLVYLVLATCLVIAVQLTPIPQGAAALYTGSTLVVLGVLATPVGYFWLPTARTGQTLGKWAAGIRVVDPETAEPPTRRAAAVRTGLALGFGAVLGLGLAVDAAFLLKDRPYFRSLKDQMAGTWVVRA
ncbi:RDD family protein [Nocardiopsis halophila]|uniref:RDD family protein n=1 Tax=Nocardiopsis halophila TaxID=141692 RepID=UPI000348F63C|nr:RDD family protein [Nocardiopsis halophila]